MVSCATQLAKQGIGSFLKWNYHKFYTTAIYSSRCFKLDVWNLKLNVKNRKFKALTWLYQIMFCTWTSLSKTTFLPVLFQSRQLYRWVAASAGWWWRRELRWISIPFSSGIMNLITASLTGLILQPPPPPQGSIPTVTRHVPDIDRQYTRPWITSRRSCIVSYRLYTQF